MSAVAPAPAMMMMTTPSPRRAVLGCGALRGVLAFEWGFYGVETYAMVLAARASDKTTLLAVAAQVEEAFLPDDGNRPDALSP